MRTGHDQGTACVVRPGGVHTPETKSISTLTREM